MSTPSWGKQCPIHKHTSECVSLEEVSSTWVAFESLRLARHRVAVNHFWNLALECTEMEPRLKDSFRVQKPSEDTTLYDFICDILAKGEPAHILELRQWSDFRLGATISPSSSDGLRDVPNPTFSSFHGLFRGQIHLVLLRSIDRYVAKISHKAWETNDPGPSEIHGTDDSHFLCPSSSFVQASGTGKSRTCYEASRERCSFSLCLRESDRTVFSFPPADAQYRDALLSGIDTTSHETTHRHVAAHITALFKVLRLTLDKTDFTNWKKKHPDSSLSEYLHQLFTDDWSMTTPSNKKTELLSQVAQEAVAIATKFRAGSWRDMEGTCFNAAKDFLIELIATEPDACRRHKYAPGSESQGAEFIIFIDEAHTIANIDVATPYNLSDSERSQSALAIYERILRWLHGLPIFFVFLSTSSKVDRILTPLTKISSFREDSRHRVFPAITEIVGFDLTSQHVATGIIETKFTLKSLDSPELAVSFGRPLWFSLFETVAATADPTSHSPMRQVLHLAHEKMSLVADAKAEIRTTAILSWLSQRYLLRFDVTSSRGEKLANDLIQTYMRMVLAISEDRRQVMSVAPSEPVLVEVATQLLIHHKVDVPAILMQALSTALLAKGERGELVYRYLHLKAHDAVHQQRITAPLEMTNKFVFHRRVSFLAWCKMLFTDDAYAELMKSRPVQSDGNAQSFEDAFKNAWMFTSHFAQAQDSDVITLAQLYKCTFRGVALQCKDNQEAVDFVFGLIFAKEEDELINISKFAPVEFQIKNCVISIDIPPITRRITDPTHLCKQPTLTIVLQLGTGHGDVHALHQAARSTRKTIRFQHYDNHYQVVVTGLKAFRMSGEDELKQVTSLLDFRTTITGMPRMDITENRELQNNIGAGINMANIAHWGPVLDSDPKLKSEKRPLDGAHSEKVGSPKKRKETV
ncbi:hypothetical protein MIND_00891000 [Mycena indigotica]|uniref:Uncharacterized protein n=1 Tax=Mycena indigotica TaxID=2126181 RepID=A0A8H6SJF8_9AGAR|nr:uncharacterized protein MIND_00891000 [Mycena indigotica]KAF7299412.1 hypothetical protein MIND_00891000 [Mycena indigotica]